MKSASGCMTCCSFFQSSVSGFLEAKVSLAALAEVGGSGGVWDQELLENGFAFRK